MCLLISVLLAPETKLANRKCVIKEVSANAFHFFPSLFVDLFTSSVLILMWSYLRVGFFFSLSHHLYYTTGKGT